MMLWLLGGIVVALVLGLGFVVVYSSTVVEQFWDSACQGADQLGLALHFKADVWVFAVLGGLLAAWFYWVLTSRQTHFGHEYRRWLIAGAAGLMLALLLTSFDVVMSPPCLRTALGPATQIDPAATLSLSGQFLQFVILTIIIDVSLVVAAGVGVARLMRRAYLRYSR
jgi:hypothetical protein